MGAVRSWLLLLALVGCYAPTINTGAPCDVDSQCPGGQACVAGRCGGSEGNDIDAPMSPIDGPIAINDPDGDGVATAIDNCPQIANADQGNEDMDKFGDACDPCPIEANDTPSDPDADGVADGCDPHPNVAGDKLVVFDGFHGTTAPKDWQAIGQVTFGNDEVTLTTVANNHAAIVPPAGPFTNGTLTVSIIVDAQVGMFDSATSITMPYDPANDQGVFCELYAPNAGSANGRYISLWDSPATMERGMDPFAWTTAAKYRVSLARTGNNYACRVIAGANSHTANGSTQSNPSPQKAAAAVYGANARVQYMMVVTSP